jgi:hypothetical protein
MDIHTHGDYVHTTQLQLDIPVIVNNCHDLHDYIKSNFGDMPQDYNGHSTLTTGVYRQYNLFLYPFAEFHKLFKSVTQMFYLLNDEPNEMFYMQCWLNFYRAGEFIDWHHHWPKELKTWHGFYCVSGKGSHTSYRLPPDLKQEIIIPTKLNQIVLSKSDGDKHKSSDWNEDYPRITIAFDIVPQKHIGSFWDKNHWIPI